MGDKGQTNNFKFSSVDTDIFDDKIGSSSGHFAFSFNKQRGFKALDEFYNKMLPPIDYSDELPEYYEYGLNKRNTNKFEACKRFKDKFRENNSKNSSTLTTTENGGGGEGPPPENSGEYKSSSESEEESEKENKKPPVIEIKPVKKYSDAHYKSAKNMQKIFRGNKARRETEQTKNENESAKRIQKVFRGNKVRNQLVKDEISPS